MIFDECTPYPADWDYENAPWRCLCVGRSVAVSVLTSRKQKCAVWYHSGQRLRRFTDISVKGLVDIGFDGYAVGGRLWVSRKQICTAFWSMYARKSGRQTALPDGRW